MCVAKALSAVNLDLQYTVPPSADVSRTSNPLTGPCKRGIKERVELDVSTYSHGLDVLSLLIGCMRGHSWVLLPWDPDGAAPSKGFNTVAGEHLQGRSPNPGVWGQEWAGPWVQAGARNTGPDSCACARCMHGSGVAGDVRLLHSATLGCTVRDVKPRDSKRHIDWHASMVRRCSPDPWVLTCD